MTEHKIRTPPEYCQYVDGPCDQDFTATTPCDALFLFPSTPPQIAATIETAKQKLELMSGATDLEVLAAASYYWADNFL